MKLEHVLIKNFKGIDLVEFAMGGAADMAPKLTALLNRHGRARKSGTLRTDKDSSVLWS